jgi:hypothetical protein
MIIFNWECHVIGTCEMWARGGNVFPLPAHKENFKILSKQYSILYYFFEGVMDGTSMTFHNNNPLFIGPLMNIGYVYKV